MITRFDGTQSLKKMQKVSKTCLNLTSVFLCLLQCVVRELSSSHFCVSSHMDVFWNCWVISDCFTCQFLNHCTKYPCFKVDTSTFISDLLTVGTKPAISEEGTWLPKTEIPQDHFKCHVWTGKVLTPLCLLRWCARPVGSPPLCGNCTPGPS